MRMDYTKIAETIGRLAEEKIGAKAAHIRLGTVVGTEGAGVSVRMDGSGGPTNMARCCPCAAGDRVVVLRQETQFYCIAKVGG